MYVCRSYLSSFKASDLTLIHMSGTSCSCVYVRKINDRTSIPLKFDFKYFFLILKYPHRVCNLGILKYWKKNMMQSLHLWICTTWNRRRRMTISPFWNDWKKLKCILSNNIPVSETGLEISKWKKKSDSVEFYKLLKSCLFVFIRRFVS